jgi:hypothetical protein
MHLPLRHERSCTRKASRSDGRCGLRSAGLRLLMFLIPPRQEPQISQASSTNACPGSDLVPPFRLVRCSANTHHNGARPAPRKEAMPTLDLLPSIRDSERIMCRSCRSRQYPRSGTCVRCHRPLGLEYLVIPIDGLLSTGRPGQGRRTTQRSDADTSCTRLAVGAEAMDCAYTREPPSCTALRRISAR